MLLGFNKTKQLLEKYNLPRAKTILLTKEMPSKEEALEETAEQIGFPLVLKVSSTNIIHRTEKQLVKTNLKNQEEAKQAFSDLALKGKNEKGFEGILVQEQLQGIELFCGLKQDPTFGSILMFGLGGVFVEALNDIAFGICPLTFKEANGLILNLQGKKILQGFRNLPPVDLNKLANLLKSISLLGHENPQFKTIDFNPIIANGKNVKIADIKISL